MSRRVSSERLDSLSSLRQFRKRCWCLRDPVPEIRSFGEAVAHVAEAQARNCNLVSGAGSKTLDADKKTKAELLAALKESFAIRCS
jgi:hypothetical protein